MPRLVPCLFAALLAAAAATPVRSAEPAQIDDGRLRLRFDPATGGLVELTAPGDGGRLIDAATVALWQVAIRDGTKLVEYSAQQAGRPHIEPFDGGRGLRLSWPAIAGRGGTPTAGPPPLGVAVEVVLDPHEPLARWRIAVDKPPAARLAEVRFPRIAALGRRPVEDLAVPLGLGQIMHNPRAFFEGNKGKGARLYWEYPHRMSLQCLALYQPGGRGFYAGCDDAEAYPKTFSMWSDADKRLAFEIIHRPEQEAAAAARYAPTYDVVTGPLEGDWSGAAQRYRRSKAAKRFAADSRLARRQVPDWVRQTGVWVWNRGRSAEVLPPAAAMARFAKVPVSVFWHWWHDCPYDAGFPEYLPPREGEASFVAAVEAAHRAGLHVTPYMNQRLWGTQTRSWIDEGAERFAVRRPDGSLQSETYNTFLKAPCAAMCLGTQFWRNKYATLAEEVVGRLKADGVYMDQACMTAECHDPAHGHIAGAGRYWLDGFAQLSLDIRDRTAGRGDVCLAGEHCGEAWLPYLDLMLTLQVSEERTGGVRRPWSVIPFFTAVYHPNVICYGSYGSLVQPPYDERWPAELAPPDRLALLDRKFSTQFLLEQARSFVWGLQPMVPNFVPSQLTARTAELDFVARAARLRVRASKYLLAGTWLRPPALESPEREIDVVQLGVYIPLKAATKRCPLVMAGAWRADDGDVGIALANIDDKPIEVRLPIDVTGYGLGTAATVDQIDDAGRRPLGTIAGSAAAISLQLPPRAATIVECRRK